MKTCAEWHEDLAEMVFGEIGPEQEARLNEHLLGCPNCRTEERRLLELREAGRGCDPEPGPELRARIAASLPLRSIPPAVLRRPVPAYVAIAAALIGAMAAAVLPALQQRKTVDTVPRDRPPGVAVSGTQMPFSVAGSYDTRVASSPAAADSGPARSRKVSDSL